VLGCEPPEKGTLLAYIEGKGFVAVSVQASKNKKTKRIRNERPDSLC